MSGKLAHGAPTHGANLVRSNLSGRLKARTKPRQEHAVGVSHAFLLGYLMHQCTQLRIIRVLQGRTHTRSSTQEPVNEHGTPRVEGSGHTHLHAREPRADGVVVGADEDVAHLHVDVVGDSNQFAGADVLTRRAHSGCEEHRLRPNKLHHHRTRTQKHNERQAPA